MGSGSLLWLLLASCSCSEPAPTACAEQVCDDNGVCWVGICGGSFKMGSAKEQGMPRERPRHEVTLPDYALSRSEITVAQYALCVEAGACEARADVEEIPAKCNWGRAGQEQHPMNCVNYAMAEGFCRWAGGRLPSEAEWEYAARSRGQDRTYPWGEAEPSCALAAIHDPGCTPKGTLEVCSKPAGNTEQGLCDMAGNAFEWCADDYVDNYREAPTDGSAWLGGSRFKVMRGGSINSDEPLYTRHRTFHDSPFFFSGMGIRCAR